LLAGYVKDRTEDKKFEGFKNLQTLFGSV